MGNGDQQTGKQGDDDANILDGGKKENGAVNPGREDPNSEIQECTYQDTISFADHCLNQFGQLKPTWMHQYGMAIQLERKGRMEEAMQIFVYLFDNYSHPHNDHDSPVDMGTWFVSRMKAVTALRSCGRMEEAFKLHAALDQRIRNSPLILFSKDSQGLVVYEHFCEMEALLLGQTQDEEDRQNLNEGVPAPEKAPQDLNIENKQENSQKDEKSIKLILWIMKRYVGILMVQLAGFEQLITPLNAATHLSEKLLQTILLNCLQVMDLFKSNVEVRRQGFRALYSTLRRGHVSMDDVTYTRLVDRAITTIQSSTTQESTRALVFGCLYRSNLRSSASQRTLAGYCGVVEITLKYIRDEYHPTKNYNGVIRPVDGIRVACSLLSYLTDTIPENCARFVDHEGMNLFLLLTKKKYSTTWPRFFICFLTAVANVAEMNDLRPKIIDKVYIEPLKQLLLDSSAAVTRPVPEEVLYCFFGAARALAHILADQCSWYQFPLLYRYEVITLLRLKINQFSVNTHFRGNTRTFKPFVDLLGIKHTTVCPLVGCWFIANALTTSRDKYISMMEREGVIDLLFSLKVSDDDVTRFQILSLVLYTSLKESASSPQS